MIVEQGVVFCGTNPPQAIVCIYYDSNGVVITTGSSYWVVSPSQVQDFRIRTRGSLPTYYIPYYFQYETLGAI